MVFLRVENTFRVEFLRCCFSIFQPFAINLIKILGDGCSCWIISDLQSARIHQLGFWRTLSLDSLSRRINFRLFIIRISVYYVNHNVLKELLVSKEKDDVAYVIQTITHICIRWGRKINQTKMFQARWLVCRSYAVKRWIRKFFLRSQRKSYEMWNLRNPTPQFY